MSQITVCLDCPRYQKGGYCPHKRKEVSALDPACDHAKIMNAKFNPEDEETPMTQVSQEKEAIMETTTITKTCPRCGRELPADAFGRHARTRDGLQPYCKDCRSAARQGKSSRPGRAVKQLYIDPEKRVVVRETLTDQQMVDLLREHGWTVNCWKNTRVEL